MSTVIPQAPPVQASSSNPIVMPNPQSVQNRLYRFSIIMMAVIGTGLVATVITGAVTEETDILKMISHDGVKETWYGFAGYAGLATLAYTFLDKTIRPEDENLATLSHVNKAINERDEKIKGLRATITNLTQEVDTAKAETNRLRAMAQPVIPHPRPNSRAAARGFSDNPFNN